LHGILASIAAINAECNLYIWGHMSTDLDASYVIIGVVVKFL